ncbi:hypothetical protein D3C84_960260 [compost metagenome]
MLAHRQAGLDQCLQTAGSGDAGQGPAGEGQQQFAGAGAENQPVVADLPATLGVFHQQGVRAGLGDHPCAAVVVHIAAGEYLLAQLTRLGRHLGLRAVAPDLSAWQRVVVEQHDARGTGGGGQCSSQAGGTGADDQQIGVV